MYPNFEVKKESAVGGRLGEINTLHGKIETPAFVFCATKGALKAGWPHMAKASNTQIILSNTYHLLVHPGSKLIHELGGLQKLTNWNGPMMTDSGGYQIFSLGYGSVSQELKGIRNTKSSLVKINEEGAKFKSYKDGSEIFLTPEGSIQAQIDFGADLIFVLDECTAFHIEKKETEASMKRSHRWEERSVAYFKEHKKSHQGIYSIVQGGIYEDLRQESIDFVNNLDTFGIGIGGSLGKDLDGMENVLKMFKNKLIPEKPRHLLGIGTIDSILMAIPYGIDTFDCVYPTRLARHGGALIRPEISEKKYLNLNNAAYAKDDRPIDLECKCCTCASFSRAYIHMLLKSNEILAQMALTEHNIAFMNRFMSCIREVLSSSENAWKEFKNDWTRKR